MELARVTSELFTSDMTTPSKWRLHVIYTRNAQVESKKWSYHCIAMGARNWTSSHSISVNCLQQRTLKSPPPLHDLHRAATGVPITIWGQHTIQRRVDVAYTWHKTSIHIILHRYTLPGLLRVPLTSFQTGIFSTSTGMYGISSASQSDGLSSLQALLFSASCGRIQAGVPFFRRAPPHLEHCTEQARCKNFCPKARIVYWLYYPLLSPLNMPAITSTQSNLHPQQRAASA